MFSKFQVVESRWKLHTPSFVACYINAFNTSFVEEEKSPNTSCDDVMATTFYSP
jgi:hypothetical protein